MPGIEAAVGGIARNITEAPAARAEERLHRRAVVVNARHEQIFLLHEWEDLKRPATGLIEPSHPGKWFAIARVREEAVGTVIILSTQADLLQVVSALHPR